MKRRSFLIGLPAALMAAKKFLFKNNTVDVGYVKDYEIDPSKIIVYSNPKLKDIQCNKVWFVDNDTKIEVIHTSPADPSFINGIHFTSHDPDDLLISS